MYKIRDLVKNDIGDLNFCVISSRPSSDWRLGLIIVTSYQSLNNCTVT